MNPCRRIAGAVAIAAAASTVFTACSQQPVAPVVVQCSSTMAHDRPGPALVGQAYGLAMTPLPLNSVQFGSDLAARSLAVQSLHASRTATQTVQLQARFVSCADRPLTLLMRTSFLRGDTAPAEAPTAWKSVYLQPRATAVYTERSVSTDAASYLIEVTQ